MFARRQTLDGIHYSVSRQSARLFDCHPFDQFRQCRPACQSRRTAVRKKPRGFDATIANAQTQAQAIAADGICFFSDGVSVVQLTRVARIREMLSKLIGIGQSGIAEPATRIVLTSYRN